MSEQGEGIVQSTRTAPRSDPVVRAITLTDVNEAWAQGIRDFRAAPAYGLVFGGLYAAGGTSLLPASPRLVLAISPIRGRWLRFDWSVRRGWSGPGQPPPRGRHGANMACCARFHLRAAQQPTRLDGSRYDVVLGRLAVPSPATRGPF